MLLLSALVAPDAVASEESPCVTRSPALETRDARELTLQGLNCFEAGRFDWALTHYQRAYEIRPEPVLLGTLGRSYHELGYYDLALEHYQRFLLKEGPTDAAERIRRRIHELEEDKAAQAGTVRVSARNTDATVQLLMENGQSVSLGASPSELSLREGRYEFLLTAEGYRPRQEAIRIRQGRVHELQVDLVSEDALFDVSQRARQRAGVITLASTLPVTAAGITLLALAAQEEEAALELDRNFTDLSDYDQRRRDHLDRSDDYRLWGSISTGVGTTGLVVGTLLVLSARGAKSTVEETSSQPQGLQAIEPVVGFNALGFRLRF